MFYKKKITELELRIEDLSNELSNCRNKFNKFERVAKYSKDNEATFNIRPELDDFWVVYNLYLYVDKEEYKISLGELEGVCKNKNCSLRVEGALIYFEAVSKLELEDDKYITKKYEFIIDYKKGKYVLSNITEIKDKIFDVDENGKFVGKDASVILP